jgi:hypothetical protein
MYGSLFFFFRGWEWFGTESHDIEVSNGPIVLACHVDERGTMVE